MGKSIFSDLPNNLIIKILHERKEIKKNEKYKNNYDTLVKDFTKRTNRWISSYSGLHNLTPLMHTFYIDEANDRIEYYGQINKHFNKDIELDFICDDVEDRAPLQLLNELNYSYHDTHFYSDY